MNILTALILLFAGLSVAARAQQAPTAEGPPGLTVLKSSWARELIPGWENKPTGAEPYDLMVSRVAAEQRAERERNAGRKSTADRAASESKVYQKANDDTTVKQQQQQQQTRFGYRYKISIRNGGPKEIKLIDWDYVFLDPATQAEIERHQFTSEERVGPGKEKALSVFKLAPPTRTVSAKASDKKDAPRFVERIVLVRVEYADGTVWPNP